MKQFSKELAHLMGRALFSVIIMALFLGVVMLFIATGLFIFQQIAWLGPLMALILVTIIVMSLVYSAIHSMTDDMLDWILLKVGILKKKPAKHDRYGGASFSDYFGCNHIMSCWVCEQNGLRKSKE